MRERKRCCKQFALVEYIYKSWFKLQKRLQNKLEGNQRWLSILKSDEELTQQSNYSPETIRSKATELLGIYPTTQSLFDAYSQTQDILESSAICYLLKNKGKIPQKTENTQKLAERRRKTEIKIERLIDQLDGRIPKGRDLTGEQWLNTLITSTTTVPENESQAKKWQDILLTKPKPFPFPVSYENNEDLTWSKNEKGRLCVKFNGLGKHTFQIYCDQRQLKWFQRFFEDQQIKKASQNKHSSALFTLRSAIIAWALGKGKGEPWNVHHLTLFCNLDTRFWSAEGTEQVRQEKAEKVIKTITLTKEKGDLNKPQKDFLKRQNSTLTRLNTPFPRPSQSLYQGQPHLLLGVSMRLEKPVTAAVVNGVTGKAITYRSLKQLLSKNYQLLNRHRKQKQRSSHQRHKADKIGSFNQFGESELGQYLDRLLAKAIVILAQEYQVGSIVVPRLEDMREIVQAEIQTLAEAKIPGNLEAQKKYAKQYRINVHQWSYGRLIDNITSEASKLGIVIETTSKIIRGSPQEIAKNMALIAYQSRSNS